MAAHDGVNEVMSDCAIESKRHHPGWQNRSTTAEGSVQILSFARFVGRRVVGVWGSRGVFYAIYLEARHGPWLRAAADKLYPGLDDAIARWFRIHTRDMQSRRGRR